MKLRSFSLKNWKNFKRVDNILFPDSVFIIGANASGKSNLLDALRFLRDVAAPAGLKPGPGGLQEAVNTMRGGLSRLRCLNARKDTEVLIEAVLEDDGSPGARWTYSLGFKGEGRGNNRIAVTKEQVSRDGQALIRPRPDTEDIEDRERLSRTLLEQTSSNQAFRPLAHFFSSITYLHLVPQLLKFNEEIRGRVIKRDPFGQGFLYRIAETHDRIRNARLRRIEAALTKVVPQFRDLRFEHDNVTGEPHLKANFIHWRKDGAWQREDQFSDGTLRLIGLLWSLMEGESLLLLEEPELSLNEEIVRLLPRLIRAILKSGKNAPRQVVITTHSEVLLSDTAIGSESVIRLRPTPNGTEVSPPTEEEKAMLISGFPVGSALLPEVNPAHAGQMLLALS